MDPVGVKTILAFVLAAAGLTAAGSMLALLGRAETKMQPGALKRIHRTAGYLFAVTLAVLAVMGAGFVSSAGDALPLRGVIHWVLGVLLVIVAIVKIVIVRYYKKFLKFAPVLGLMTVVLALLVAVVSAGFVLVSGDVGHHASGVETVAPARATERGGGGKESAKGAVVTEETAHEVAASEEPAGGVEEGLVVFRSNCAACHNVETANPPMGFVGLFGRESLSSSGLPVTPENVRGQIVDPIRRMPSFRTRLSDSDIADVLAYLETL